MDKSVSWFHKFAGDQEFTGAVAIWNLKKAEISDSK